MTQEQFLILTTVSIEIEGEECHKAVVNWFLGACILHNILTDENDIECDNTEELSLCHKTAAHHTASPGSSF